MRALRRRSRVRSAPAPSVHASGVEPSRFGVSLRWAALGALTLGVVSVLPWRFQVALSLSALLAWVGLRVRRGLRGAVSAALVAAIVLLVSLPRGGSEQLPAPKENDLVAMGLSLGDAAVAPAAAEALLPPSTVPTGESCDPLPRSTLVLVVETDLPAETLAPFLCGVHAAALELGTGPLRVQLALFSDRARLQESVERLVPGLQFAGSPVESGQWGLIGEDVIFWNYENTLVTAAEEAEVFRVGAHEFYHRFQFSLMTTDMRSAAPVWLVEGAAEYFALSMLDAYGFSEHVARYEQWGAGYAATYSVDPGSLANWESQPFAESMRPYVVYPVVAEIAEMLVERSSEETLLRTFWEDIGADDPWPEVFRRLFGVAVTEFYGIVDERFG